MKKIIKYAFGYVKPLKIHGQAQGSSVHFVSNITSNNIQVQNALETLIASLATCELGTLKIISKNSNLKIDNVKFVRVESGIDLQRFTKGGPQNRIENVIIEAEVQTNVTQEELDQWIRKTNNCCPIYQMLKSAGVKIDSKWKKVKDLL